MRLQTELPRELGPSLSRGAWQQDGPCAERGAAGRAAPGGVSRWQGGLKGRWVSGTGGAGRVIKQRGRSGSSGGSPEVLQTGSEAGGPQRDSGSLLAPAVTSPSY